MAATTVRLVSVKDPRKTKDVAPRFVETLIRLGLYRYPTPETPIAKGRAKAKSLTAETPASPAPVAEPDADAPPEKTPKPRTYRRRDMEAEE